jgi:hypothetical protein
MRSGTFVKQPGGYRAFSPAPLPPHPPIEMDLEMARLLSEGTGAQRYRQFEYEPYLKLFYSLPEI